MPLRTLGIIAALLLISAWLILRSDSESLVRDAHAELAELIGKQEEQSGPAVILNARALQNLFAERVMISGDADGLAREHAAEELAGTIVRLRSVFERIELSFGELAISFPAETEAVTEFSAVLRAENSSGQIEPVSETRRVTSRMQEIDGEWLFAEFQLVE